MEGKKGLSDLDDDIPSDFFDDFAKEEFMEGLSVIDSWGDDIQPDNEIADTKSGRKVYDVKTYINKYKMVRRKFVENEVVLKKDNVDKREIHDYIEPGSRRDPAKTNKAIKKDKEKKVKELLAKCLESSDNLKPPGTELDEFNENNDIIDVARQKKKSPSVNKYHEERSHSRYSPSYFTSHGKPPWRDNSWRARSPKDYYRKENTRYKSRNNYYTHENREPSPKFKRRSHSPHQRSFRHHSQSSRHYSPQYGPKSTEKIYRKKSPYYRRNSPQYRPHSPYYRRHSPHRRSRSPQVRLQSSRHRSRSPRPHLHSSHNKSTPRHRSRSSRESLSSRNRSNSPKRRSPFKDPFLYPDNPHYSVESSSHPSNTYIPTSEAQDNIVGYPYSAQPEYTSNYHNYDSTVQPPSYTVPTPVPAPVPPLSATAPQKNVSNQCALEKLVADGSISKADYLKLAPTPDMSIPVGSVNIKTKIELLSRCHDAVSKLSRLQLPNRLVMLNQMPSADPKPIMPRFCSPLKREPTVTFNFTNVSGVSIKQQNKQLVDRIIAAVGLDNVVEKQKKKSNMRDVSVQTSTPFCQTCEIRESAIFSDACTAVDPGYFTSSVQTQVIDEDLLSSKSIFKSGGGIADGAPVSICHLTPAQLVSQLAARAKTLKSNEESPAQSHYRPHNREQQNSYKYGHTSHYNKNYRY